MARELPIHNGRMTTDLDANGFRIKNLPPGSGFTQAQADWSQTDATAPDFIKNKPTIPAAVTVDATLATQGAAADAKAVGDALAGKLDGAAAYQAWGPATLYVTVGTVVSHAGRLWRNREPVTELEPGASGVTAWEEVFLKDLKQDALSAAQLGAVNSGATAAKVQTWDGYAAQIAQKANTTDLPYRLVEPSVAYELSAATSPIMYYDDGVYVAVDTFVGPIESGAVVTGYMLKTVGGSNIASYTTDGTFVQYESSGWFVGEGGEDNPQIVLTGNLSDRAGNLVVVSGDTTLTLPDANPGYLRDFLVRLEISGSTVPTITFAAPTGETIVYETDGDEFPVPDEAGDWLYSFTESCVAHEFAVSLKKVNTVVQGGA